MADKWLKIRTEYINTKVSYRQLAEKYGVSIDSIKKKAAAGKWREERTKAAPILHQKVQEKVQEKIAVHEADRTARLLAASDRLLSQLERATEELDRQMVKNKRKTRVVEYKDNNAPCKPTKEVISEEEEVVVVPGVIDRMGLQLLSAALKNIRDIQAPDKDSTVSDGTPVIPDAVWRELMNPAYAEHLTDERPMQIYFGGSSSGKSYGILGQRTVRDMLRGERNFLILRKTARTIRNSCYNEITKCINRMDLGGQFTVNKSDMVITHKASGRQIIFAGLDDVEKVKSITPAVGVITDILVEEATEIEYNDYKSLIKRLRGRCEVAKRFVLLFNPVTQDHWIYTEFFVGRFDDEKGYFFGDDLGILRTTYKDNRFLTQDDINLLEGETDKYYYDVYTLGRWGVLGHLIFTNWETQDLSKLLKTTHQFYNGQDFGFYPDPAAFVRVGFNRAKKEVYIFKESKGTHLTNDVLAKEVKPIIGREVLTCDSAEPKSIQELNDFGILAVPARKGPGSLEFGVKWLQRMKIIVDVGCTETVGELRKYKYREDRDGNVLPQPVDKDNHLLDALRYALEDIMVETKVS